MILLFRDTIMVQNAMTYRNASHHPTKQIYARFLTE